MFKALFKDSHPVVQLLMLLTFVFAGAMAGQFIGIAVVFLKYGFSKEIVEVLLQNITDYPAVIREMQFFSSLGTFVFPALALAYLFSDNYKNYLKIDTPVYFSPAIWTIISMVVGLPFLNFIAYYNQQIHFPEFLKPLEEILRAQENSRLELTESLLNAENVWALILNIVVIGIFAAVGEEFIFRGILQNVFSRFIGNIHVVIWLVAIIFSLAHFQFFGFVLRVLLGAYLGYLVYFTKNIWIPVLAHLVNNLIIILSYWHYGGDKLEEIGSMEKIGTWSYWLISFTSLTFFLLIFRTIRKQSRLCEEEQSDLQDFSS
jgi:CAAX amino terminal protease family.